MGYGISVECVKTKPDSKPIGKILKRKGNNSVNIANNIQEKFLKKTHVNLEYLMWEIYQLMFPEEYDGLGKGDTGVTYFYNSMGEPTGNMTRTPTEIKIVRF